MSPPENDLTGHYKALLSKEYKDPYIQVITPPCPWWVPGLVLVGAVERAYLNEDPVHMDHWIITPRNHVFRSWEFPIAVAELDLAPATTEDAIGAAKTAIFLENDRDNQDIIFDPQESGGIKLPPDFLDRLRPPIVQETRWSYTVILHAILHTSPGWQHPGKHEIRLVLFRVLVARGSCKIVQETKEGEVTS